MSHSSKECNQRCHPSNHTITHWMKKEAIENCEWIWHSLHCHLRVTWASTNHDALIELSAFIPYQKQKQKQMKSGASLLKSGWYYHIACIHHPIHFLCNSMFYGIKTSIALYFSLFSQVKTLISLVYRTIFTPTAVWKFIQMFQFCNCLQSWASIRNQNGIYTTASVICTHILIVMAVLLFIVANIESVKLRYMLVVKSNNCWYNLSRMDLKHVYCEPVTYGIACISCNCSAAIGTLSCAPESWCLFLT